jgi:hypothetical protein
MEVAPQSITATVRRLAGFPRAMVVSEDAADNSTFS